MSLEVLAGPSSKIAMMMMMRMMRMMKRIMMVVVNNQPRSMTVLDPDSSDNEKELFLSQSNDAEGK